MLQVELRVCILMLLTFTFCITFAARHQKHAACTFSVTDERLRPVLVMVRNFAHRCTDSLEVAATFINSVGRLHFWRSALWLTSSVTCSLLLKKWVLTYASHWGRCSDWANTSHLTTSESACWDATYWVVQFVLSDVAMRGKNWILLLTVVKLCLALIQGHLRVRHSTSTGLSQSCLALSSGLHL